MFAHLGYLQQDTCGTCAIPGTALVQCLVCRSFLFIRLPMEAYHAGSVANFWLTAYSGPTAATCLSAVLVAFLTYHGSFLNTANPSVLTLFLCSLHFCY